MSRIDFERLKKLLLVRAESLCLEWLPDGELKGREWTALNPRRSDSKKGSFRVNVDSGVWKDFAMDGVGGSDFISLFAYLRDYQRMGDAARVLLGEIGEKPLPVTPSSQGKAMDKQSKAGRRKWMPIVPAPADPPADYRHYKFGTAVKRWIYRDADGMPLCGVYRFDLYEDDGSPMLKDGKRVKEFLPLTWCQEENGTRRAWAWRGLPKPRPLYQLDRIAAHPSAALVFTEGEKAADAAQALFNFSDIPDMQPLGFVATCSLGGEGQWRQTDIEPARGRQCFVWRDNDDAGLSYARGITKLLMAMGCAVTWIRIPEDAPPKWDAADALEDGWTPAKIADLIRSGKLVEDVQSELVQVKSVPKDPTPAKSMDIDPLNPPWPKVENWTVNQYGVRDIQFQPITWSPIWIEAITQDHQGRRGMLLRFYDIDKNAMSLAVPAAILNEQGNVLGKILQERGFPIIPGKEKWVCRYLSQLTIQVERRIHASARLGWYDHPYNSEIAFILPNQILGSASIELTYQPDGYTRTAENIQSQGTLQEWHTSVRDPCRGNPFLMFAVLMALAGPLLKVVRESTGGFHFFGVTTGGKTTMAQVAASVWGCGADPQTGPEHTIIQTWDTSPTGLEEAAQLFNDMLLSIDEIQKGEPEKVAMSIYKLIGGVSKLRGMAQGGLREQKTWRLLALSTGEISVRQMFHRAGIDLKGGQRVRFADIPVDDERGKRSIVVDTHGTIKPGDSEPVQKEKRRLFVESLKSAAARCYGVAGPTFVCYLVSRAQNQGWSEFSASIQRDMELMEKLAASRRDESTGKTVELVLPEELMRVTKRFALVGLAGFLALQAGILDWKIEEIAYCVRFVRDSWLSEQGDGKSEIERSLESFRDNLISNSHRFLDYDKDNSGKVKDVIGYRYIPLLSEQVNGIDRAYYAMTEKGIREICGDYDARIILRELRNQKMLWHDKGRLTHKAPEIASLQGARPYLYFISAAVIGELSKPNDKKSQEVEGLPF